MENWKDIAGFEGKYQVSDLGRVRSLPQSFIRKDGRRFIVKGKILKQTVSAPGYKVVNIGKKVNYVHRLIANAFIPNVNALNLINHLDGDKLNNSLSNLEWCDHSRNIQHAYDNKLRVISDKHRKSSRNNMMKNRRDCSVMVLNTSTGVFFSSIKEAAKSICVDASTISRKLSVEVFNNTDFIYA